ncbi:hypothetical protein ILYODFUR_033109 [Ilyodon furcidens]|uniref:Uncharacterized protein n=1 Tax=Ilyodon furcidens TaxID=33524 RepID=A0ABV0UX92_9TELE
MQSSNEHTDKIHSEHASSTPQVNAKTHSETRLLLHPPFNQYTHLLCHPKISKQTLSTTLILTCCLSSLSYLFSKTEERKSQVLSDNSWYDMTEQRHFKYLSGLWL